jgi:hypothetical protein
VQNPTDSQKRDTESATFEVGQVFTLNISISTGTGVARNSTARTTVYKRNPDSTYQLKLKTSRALFSGIAKECGTMAFTLSQLGDEKKARMGIVECETHALVNAYPVLMEEGAVARVMATVLLMPNGPLVVSGQAMDAWVQSDKSIVDETLKALVEAPLRAKKAKKAKAAE